MKEFMGDKAVGRKRWHIPVLIFLGLMAIGSVLVIRDDLVEGKDDMWASFVLLALFVWGIWAILRGWARYASAEKFARALASTQEEKLSFERLRSLTHVQNAETRIRRLLNAGYLKGISLDFGQNALVFHGHSHGGESAAVPFVEAECPGCGAKTTVRVGRVGKCEFCGTKLVAHQNRT